MPKQHKDYESTLLLVFFAAMGLLYIYVKYRVYMSRFPTANWWTFFFK